MLSISGKSLRTFELTGARMVFQGLRQDQELAATDEAAAGGKQR